MIEKCFQIRPLTKWWTIFLHNIEVVDTNLLSAYILEFPVFSIREKGQFLGENRNEICRTERYTKWPYTWGFQIILEESVFATIIEKRKSGGELIFNILLAEAKTEYQLKLDWHFNEVILDLGDTKISLKENWSKWGCRHYWKIDFLGGSSDELYLAMLSRIYLSYLQNGNGT